MAFHNVPPNGFPDLPDVEELEAVVKDVTTLKTSVSGLSEDVSDLEEQKANQITIAPAFNAETTYEVGDLVYYNGLSYRCTNEHTGEWDADDFTGTTIENELASLKSGLTNLTSANGGDAVDITDRVGSANAYLVPANGYITLDTGASSSGGIDIRITGANGYGLAYIIISSVTSNVVQSVYVRKGMYAYITSNTTGSSIVKFRPFT